MGKPGCVRGEVFGVAREGEMARVPASRQNDVDHTFNGESVLLIVVPATENMKQIISLN